MNQPMLLDSERAYAGIQNLLDDYLALQPSDIVLFCFQDACKAAAAWLLMGLKQASCEYRTYNFAHRDDRLFESDMDQMLSEMRREFPENKITLLVAEGSTLSFTLPLKSLKRKYDLEVLRLMNFGRDLFELGVIEKKIKLKQINSGLLHRLMQARQLKITSAAGTDLRVELDSDLYQWVSNHGTPGERELMVLPAGEVNTYPKRVDGIFVAEGALHSNFAIDFDVRLAACPATFEIRDNVVQAWHCDQPQIQAFLDFMFSRKHGRRVGELGIGTNIGIDSFTPFNSHINERHPGVHLGFGEHTQPRTVAYQAEFHMDAISVAGQIEIVGEPGYIDVARLAASELSHPAGTRCEDIEHVPN